MNTVVVSLAMNGKKAKWQWQCWKTSPTWDPVILPRPFPLSSIRSMRCYLLTYIIVLSEDSNVEIWNSKQGKIVLQHCFSSELRRIDFLDMYCKETKFPEEIKNWKMILANAEGVLFSGDCDSLETLETWKICTNFVKNCFYKLINETHTIILIGIELWILSCETHFPLKCLKIPESNLIDCYIILKEDAVLSSSQKLYFFNNILSEETIGYHSNMKDNHKSTILKLIEIDTTYMASISWEKVAIWKKPVFNLTKLFDLSGDTSFVGHKSLTCLVHNARYLIVGRNVGFMIFDCTTGYCVTEVQYASDTQIIKIIHLDWLSMLLTISNDGRLRFWAFQQSDSNIDFTKTSISPSYSKSTSFTNYSRQSSTNESNQLSFLGKSFEKNKEKCQISCFLELENVIKSNDHFVNLEELGMLTNDGSSTLVLWRNRDHAFSHLIQILQS